MAIITLCCALLCSCSVSRRAADGSAAPVIGVSAAGQGQSKVGQAYIDAVVAAGGIPLIIPILTDSTAVAALLDKVDGVLLIGGEDIDPSFYGEDALPEMGEINAPRDTFDLMLCRMTRRAHKPLLAVCRGVQVLNVAFGGSLWQDIPSQIPSSEVCHKAPEGQTAFHDIDVAAGSVLASLIGAGTVKVNSFHHQAAKSIAKGFEVSAVAPDGVVEGMERFKGGDRILGVQFHPEKMFAEGDHSVQAVFEWLIKESQK